MPLTRNLDLQIREDAAAGIVVAGLTREPLRSSAEAMRLLERGAHARATAKTAMNLVSSRSHSVR